MLILEEKPGTAGGGSVGCRRRRWSEAQKRKIMAEIHEPGGFGANGGPTLQPQRQPDTQVAASISRA